MSYRQKYRQVDVISHSRRLMLSRASVYTLSVYRILGDLTYLFIYMSVHFA